MIKKRLAILVKSYFRYFAFFYSYIGKKMFVIILLSFLVGMIDALGLSLFIPLFESAGTSETSSQSDVAKFIGVIGIPFTVNWLLGLMIVFFSLKAVIKYCDYRIRNQVAQRFGSKIRTGLITALSRLHYNRFVQVDQGMIQNTVTVESSNVMNGYMLYISVVQNAIFLFVYIGLSFVSNWKFTILIMIGGYLSRLILNPMYNSTRQISTQITGQNHVYASQVIQQITNFKYLKSTGQMTTYANKLRQSIAKNERSQYNLAKITAFILSFREPLLVLFVCLTIFIQYNFVEKDLSSILLSLILFYRGFNSMMLLQSSWTGFLKYTGSIEHIEDFKKDLLRYQESVKGEEFSGFNQKLVFDNVSFYYHENSPILKNLNFEIQKFNSIALVGKSGSGKTTLANLISGILEPNSGEIRLDDQQLSVYNKDSYRSKVGLISQETVVFNDTFYNNITFWSEATPENIERFWDVVARADLNEFVEGLPLAENTLLGDGGIIMSGGQRQRLSIARELFRNTQILILDEATSALDSQTEKLIQSNIDAIKGQSTLVIIAHRLSTIKNVDQIFLLDQGEIIARGTFDELCESSALFAKMVNLQEI